MATSTEKLGTTASQRYQTLLAEAKRLIRERTFLTHSWKQQFSGAVAQMYPSDEKSGKSDRSRLYDYLSHLPAEELQAIRVVCIGETAEVLYQKRSGARKVAMDANKAARSGSEGGKNRLSEADMARALEIDTEYESAIEKIPPGDRTIDNLIGAIHKPRVFVVGYLQSRPNVAAKLLDGNKLFTPWAGG